MQQLREDVRLKLNGLLIFFLFIQLIGYAQNDSIRIIVQNGSIQNKSELWELSLEELMNINVITSTGYEQKMSEAPSTMLVITSKQISERGYEQLDDVLRDIPGVDLIHIYGQAPTFITFRGMYGDENRRMLFMIDGIVENSIMGGFEIAGPAYSLHNVERIEIIWGPGSALYGANAFSAVINIITKKGSDINGLHYQKGFGAFNTSVENVLIGVKKSNLPDQAGIDLALSGSLYNTDGPRFANRDPRYSNSYVNNAFSINGNIIYTMKEIKATLGVRDYQTPGGQGELAASPTLLLGLPSQGNQNSGKGGILQSDFNNGNPSLADIFARTAFLQTEFTSDLYKGLPGSKFMFFVKGQYRETGRSDKSYAYVNNPGTGFVSRNPIAYYANRIGGEISANFIFTESHSFSSGFQIFQDNLENGFRGIIPDTRFDTIENIPVTNIHPLFKPRDYSIQNNLGGYVQYVLNTNLLRKTNFTLGTRFDNNSIYKSTINPRIGIINQPGKNITFKLLAGTAFRAPTNFELTEVIGSRIVNLELKPEKIQTYELNLIYNPLKILLVQANVFRNELSDIIVLRAKVEGSKSQNQNIGTAYVTGFETRFDLIPSKSVEAFLNFTYQTGRQNNGITESAIPNIAEVKANIGFSVFLGDLINISMIGNWVGDRSVPATNPLGKAEGYFIPNLAISTKKLYNNRVCASLNIRNLFNHTYYDPGIRAADGNLYGTVHEQPGINGLFKISVNIF